jgi:dUTPase
MLLNRDQIRERGLVEHGVESGFRIASYDLRVGRIITPESTLVDSYTMPPQGIVEVVSQEAVALPPGVSGYALIKNSLSDAGVLAVNIGIIDPGYRGPISSTLINFGKNPYHLVAGEVFLRLTFQSIDEVRGATYPQPIPYDAYVDQKKKKVAQNFGETFLDIEETAGKAAEKAFAEYRTGLFIWVPAFALLLTLFTFLLNFSGLWSQRNYQPADQARTELERQTADLAHQNELLRVRLEQLERRVGETQLPAASGTPGPGRGAGRPR